MLINEILAGPVLKVICFAFCFGGWILYFRSFKYRERVPFKWHIRFRDDGTMHISTYCAKLPPNMIEAVKYMEEE